MSLLLLTGFIFFNLSECFNAQCFVNLKKKHSQIHTQTHTVSVHTIFSQLVLPLLFL